MLMMIIFSFLKGIFPYLGQVDNYSPSFGLEMMTEHIHSFLLVDLAESCIHMVYCQSMDNPY
jgi:hypothetical protein